jgi:adhesin/invasin
MEAGAHFGSRGNGRGPRSGFRANRGSVFARAILLVAVLLAAACNDGSGGGSPSEPPPGGLALELTATPTMIPSTGSSLIRVRATRNGAPAAGVQVRFSWTLGQIDDPLVTTGNDGRASTTLVGIGSVGTAHITGQAVGEAATASVDVRVGLDRFLTLLVQPTTISGSQTATVRATLRDPNGTPVSGASVTFASTLGTLGASTATTNTQGIAATTLSTSSEFGTAQVSVSLSGVATATAEVVLQPTFVLQLQASPTVISTSGRSTISIQLTALDPTASNARRQLQVVSSLGRVDTPVTTNNAGQASTTLTADGRVGTATVTVTVQGGTASPGTVEVQIQ